MTLADKVAIKLGYTNAGIFLGKGVFGRVYQLTTDSVLKITHDDDEVKVASRMISSSDVNLIRVYFVVKLNETSYAIIRESLKHDRKLIREMWLKTYGLEHPLSYHISSNDVIKFYKKNKLSLAKDVNKFYNDVYKTATSMKKLGIMAWDFKPKNLGVNRHGNYTLFDLSGDTKVKLKIPLLK